METFFVITSLLFSCCLWNLFYIFNFCRLYYSKSWDRSVWAHFVWNPRCFLWLPSWLSWWTIWLRCGRPGFYPWFENIPLRSAWQPTLEFFPGDSPRAEQPVGLQSVGSQRLRPDWAPKHSTVLPVSGYLVPSLGFGRLQPNFFKYIFSLFFLLESLLCI